MDDNWLSGGCQILRFPGFIVSPDRKQVYKDCTVHCSSVEMAKQITGILNACLTRLRNCHHNCGWTCRLLSPPASHLR
jgi:hypothetical protein